MMMVRKSTKVATEQVKPSRPKGELSPEAELALIQGRLGHPSSERIDYWLDSGNKDFNAVMGSPDKGMPYGKIIEIAGFESHGKTAIAYGMAAIAQKDGAKVGIWDLESSWDPEWARKRGLNPDEVIVFRPLIGVFGTEKKKRMATAEEMMEQVEMWMERKNDFNPNGRIFLLVDSIAAMETTEDLEAGVQGRNMRTKVSAATFLSFMLKRWQKIAVNYNVLMVFINQIRVAPGVRFGNPEYTPGGNAMRFFAAVRVRLRRKGGVILKEKKEIGFQGVITNWKNKSGEGSREHLKCGFKLLLDGRSKFVPADSIKYDKKEKEE